jgi:hypothetical protein
MKITDQIMPVQSIGQLRPLKSVSSVGQVTPTETTTNDVVSAILQKKAQPVDLLSKDELTMLKQYFPEKGVQQAQPGAYGKNRTPVHTAQLGNYVDIKK